MPDTETRESNERRARLAHSLAVAVAGLVVVLGVVAAVTPDMAIAISRNLVSPLGIYSAAALRCGVGVALLLIAQGSRAPTILRIMGVAGIVAGLTFPLLGVDSAKARIEWEAGHLMFLRFEGLLFIWGGFTIYKLAKPQRVVFSSMPADKSFERTPEG